jgi:hypothetical protein
VNSDRLWTEDEDNTVGSRARKRLDPVTTESASSRWCASIAKAIKSTAAIIRQPFARVIVQGEDIVCTIRNDGQKRDVGSSHPGAVVGPKGWAVRPLKRYAIWVQNVELLRLL